MTAAPMPTVGQVQRRLRAIAREVEERADALDVRALTPRTPPMMRTEHGDQAPDWNRLAEKNRDLRTQAEELRELAKRIRDAAKG